MAFNRLTLSGVVSSEPSFFKTSSGVDGCNFYIRSADITYPVQFTAYGNLKEKGAESLQKGDYVNIDGYVNTRQSHSTGAVSIALVASYVENISAIMDVMCDDGDGE